MPEFTQQATIAIGPAPIMKAGLPTISQQMVLQGNTTAIALVQCETANLGLALAMGIGAALDIAPALVNLWHVLFGLYVRSSVVGPVKIANGASVIWYHNFVAAGEVQMQWPVTGFLTPNVGAALTFFNDTGVAGVFDVLLYTGKTGL